MMRFKVFLLTASLSRKPKHEGHEAHNAGNCQAFFLRDPGVLRVQKQELHN